VKVYVVVPAVAVLIVAGLHVPLILLEDVVGSGGAVEFKHRGPSSVKVGVIGATITTSILVAIAHWLGPGVKV
jgi:hypothetical protein